MFGISGQYRHTSHTPPFRACTTLSGLPSIVKKVLKDELPLRELIRQICNAEKVEILGGVIGSDHVHVMLEVPPYMAVSSIVHKAN
jgi:putative transposase